MLTDLSDQIHVLQQIPKSVTAVHYYTFTAVRGQKVLLTHSGEAQRAAFNVEYLAGDRWEVLVGDSKTFSGLGANGTVIVRVMNKMGVPRTSAPYRIILGSYPVLQKYEFKDEAYVNRIPTGHTEPSWFTTQGYTDGVLEASFTDSVGAPLRGALGRFVLSLKESGLRPVIQEVTSDENGKVSRLVTFDRCAGGREARDYITYNLGQNTWRSYYYTGGYIFTNVLLEGAGGESTEQDVRSFGHICKQRLIKSSAG